MIKLEINNFEFFTKSSISVLEACKYVGIIIPRFCYHETLSVSGNCRMCLVELNNSPKPVASCALPVLNNMKIYSNSALVKKSRENILEILLANHPLDCPICDQAGECDLQDQIQKFGNDHSRFFINKKTIEDKNCGHKIKTIMTRCIYCTRCVRFSTEISGIEYFGTLNRGKTTEISSYLKLIFNSEIAGNVIDLCPVGALTSKSYSFTFRPWELRSFETIDSTDGLGSNIYVNFKESEISRILPKINTEINDNIISDKARFYFDSNKSQRLNAPNEILFEPSHINLFKKNLKYQEISWKKVIENIKSSLFNLKSIVFLINNELDMISIFLLKLLSNQYNKKLKIKTLNTNKALTANTHISWVKNKITDLNKNSKVCFIFSSNIRIESAILNTKLRIKLLNDDIKIFGLSYVFNTNFELNFINLNINKFLLFLEGKDFFFSKYFIKFSNPIFCFGENLNTRNLSLTNILYFVKNLNSSTIFLNIQKNCNTEASFLLGVFPVTTNDFIKAHLCFVIDLDNTFFVSKYLNKLYKYGHQSIWFNTHKSQLALKSKLIIPLISEFEEEKIFINLEEKFQSTNKIIQNTNYARSFIAFINLLLLSKNTFTYTFKYSRNIIENNVLFKNFKPIYSNSQLLQNPFILSSLLFSNYPIKSTLVDFYCSNKMTKNSLTMINCSIEFRNLYNNFF
jgi:NADH-quinone oxidoreductase subunit G